MIQAEVAKKVVSKIPLKTYDTVLDLGCGNGALYRCFKEASIEVKKFIVLDASQEMLALHPTALCVEKIQSDFNKENFLSSHIGSKLDMIVSASAIQWSQNLDATLSELSVISDVLHAAIFTSNTFKTIQKVANTKSPIYDAKTLKKVFLEHYAHAEFEVHTYTLEFDSRKEMFNYIKKSGVSGGEKRLSYTEVKKLIKTYPLDYLEFEVLFVEANNS